MTLVLLAGFVLHPLPDQPQTSLAMAYYASGLAATAWLCAALLRGHEWASGVGTLFSILGLADFGPRLSGVGPKPVGLLGAQSR